MTNEEVKATTDATYDEDEGNSTAESMTNNESMTTDESMTNEVVQATAGVADNEDKGNEALELTVSNESMTNDESAVPKASVMTNTVAGNNESTVDVLMVDGEVSSASESSSDGNERAGSDVEQARLARKKARKVAKRLRVKALLVKRRRAEREA